MKTITVEVTQEDINNGKPCKGTECPVALALKRYLNVPFKVGISNICFEDYTYLRLPDKVIDFITKVDCRNPVEPISFEFQFFTGQLKPCLRN